MKRVSLIAITALLLTLGTAFAQGHGPGGPPPSAPGFGPNGADVLKDYLSLTADQVTAWQTIQSQLRTTVESLREQQRTLHDALKTALEGTDAAAIGNLMLQIRAIDAQIKGAHDTADAQFAALLTAEQKVKFEAFQAAAAYLRSHGPEGPR